MICVVVPLRTDDPDRIAAAGWLNAWYAANFPGWRWVVADCDGPWSKPRALNQTIDGLDCATLVVTDADVFIDPDRLLEATSMSPWVVPHSRTVRLTADATRQVYQGHPPDPDGAWKNYKSVAGGGLFVMPRSSWVGMDERFTGWGCEDQAFAIATDTLAGSHVRLDGPMWHLWHPPGLRKKDPTYAANRKRLKHYQRASGDVEAMLKLGGRDAPTAR